MCSQAMRLAVQRMQNIAQQLMATSAAHKAVSRDMDIVVVSFMYAHDSAKWMSHERLLLLLDLAWRG